MPKPKKNKSLVPPPVVQVPHVPGAIYVGLDQSLTGTGLVILDDQAKLLSVNLFKTEPGLTPMDEIKRSIDRFVVREVEVTVMLFEELVDVALLGLVVARDRFVGERVHETTHTITTVLVVADLRDVAEFASFRVHVDHGRFHVRAAESREHPCEVVGRCFGTVCDFTSLTDDIHHSRKEVIAAKAWLFAFETECLVLGAVRVLAFGVHDIDHVG